MITSDSIGASTKISAPTISTHTLNAGHIYGGAILRLYSSEDYPTKIECNGNVISMRAKKILLQTGGLQITNYDNILPNGDPHVEPTIIWPGTNIKDAGGKWLIRAGHWVADLSDEEIEEQFGPTTKAQEAVSENHNTL